MKCDFCNQNEATYILEIDDEKGRRKYSICESCLKQVIKDIFKGTYIMKEEKAKKCPKCNRSLEEIKETGMLGCSYCYAYFRDEIEKMVYQYHGNKIHKGKIPAKKEFRIDKILKYKIELSKAIEEEDYEKAAKLRDLLKNIDTRGG
ncbi:UvrB/UvrC motif-containing protein [Dictyoglomus thermophilum]|uniref:UvrB/UvrC motif domain protein n=2 Tax=Dictyoglomus thermophilum TaxID=14 RepID=B5YF83_DICT6|nr:UvrB/UvrC motif-containing protein [Dictyoglomus thermophilum]ACI19370.1 UvrB/UvrC motif domain protein [Dictyoglomus thermophilum H-6-12]MCX7719892.1 UvrB/UvrC motif-containing protein [Dictyoglomus thermophilum]TYT22659.1 excinuclease ABC subunit B [Dictyoglomus thermophilum]